MSEEKTTLSPNWQNVSAIVLAGGYSSRMKDFKPLMPLGDSTVIEYTIKVFKNAGIRDIIVVIGYKADELKIVLERADVRYVYNENFNEGMYSSIVKGVKSLRSGTEAFLLLPADMPLIDNNTINKLLQAYKENKPDIVYPVYQEQRGHPPLISSNLFGNILNWDGTGGLRALLARHQNRIEHVEVEDVGILTDIDTPEDYIEMCKLFLLRNSKEL